MSRKKTTATETARRVVGYVRVSTGRQADTGHSLEAQRAKLDAYCALYGYDLVAVEADEGASARTTDGRPGLARALGLCRAGKADAVLVVKLDRLTRSTRDLGALLDESSRAGWGILSVGEQLDTTSAAGRLVVGVLGVVSQWEREAAAERTSEAMQGMRARDLYTGGKVRYGYRVGTAGELVPDPAEQLVLAGVRELRDAGLSLRATSAELARRGLLARSGKPFGLNALMTMEAA
jgi:site-specific DNA recombinase